MLLAGCLLASTISSLVNWKIECSLASTLLLAFLMLLALLLPIAWMLARMLACFNASRIAPAKRSDARSIRSMVAWIIASSVTSLASTPRRLEYWMFGCSAARLNIFACCDAARFKHQSLGRFENYLL
jgi:hypothetical protein